MITFALLAALIGQTPAQEAQATPAPAAAPTIVLTSRASNGDLRGSTTVAANGVWYAYSAPNACTTVISQTMPATASVAWQLEIAVPPAGSRFWRFKSGAGDQGVQGVPLQFYREAMRDKLGVMAGQTVVSIQVTSQRRWEGGVRKDGPARTTQLSLRPGTSVMLDYVSTSPTEACNAVGVSLEIASPPARTTTTIETDLWLVHRLPDGSEQTQRQTLRSRLAGNGTDYYFDDIKVATPRGEVTVEILGRVVPYAKVADAEGDKLRVTVEIQRRYATTSPAIGWKTRSGGTTNNVEATPGEVLSFNLPPLDDDGVLTGHRFSLRLQPTQVRPGA